MPTAAARGAGEGAPRVGTHFHQKNLLKEAKAPVPVPPETEGERTTYVSNLDWSVDEALLHRIFGEIDGLREVRLVKDFLSRSKGYAYIDFASSDDVTAAVEKFDGFLINKRPMRVARSLPTKVLYEERTLFLSKLAAEGKEEEIRAAFSAHGAIKEVRFPLHPDGSRKGHAYVEFELAESLEAALQAEGPVIAGQKTKAARSIPMKNHRHTTAAPRKDLPQRLNQKPIIKDIIERQDPVKQAAKHQTTVYVKNLAFDVDDEKLKAHFSPCGKVERTLICRNALGFDG